MAKETLLPKESLLYWQSQILVDPETFAQLSDQAKSIAWMISSLTDADQLESVWESVLSSIEKGLTYQDFQDNCQEIFSDLGWVGAGAYRAELIYRNAMQSALMAGQYMQLMNDIDIFKFWQYVAVRDDRTRPSHAAMGGRVFPAGSEIWRTWWPPNGHNCRCSVIGLTEEEVFTRGMNVEYNDPTGETYPLFDKNNNLKGYFQLKPDAGWASNVGMNFTEAMAEVAGKKIKDYPSWIASLTLQNIITDTDAELLLSNL